MKLTEHDISPRIYANPNCGKYGDNYVISDRFSNPFEYYYMIVACDIEFDLRRQITFDAAPQFVLTNIHSLLRIYI